MKVLLQTDFENDPLKAGWTYSQPKERHNLPVWSDAAAHSGKRCLATQGATWESPKFPVAPFSYYKVTFHSKTDDYALWAAMFFDADGKPLIADSYSSIERTDKWAKTESCFQAKAGAAQARIVFQPVTQFYWPLYVDDVTVQAIDGKGVAEWADALYRTLPPLQYAPPEDRWALLPKTAERLREGGALRIVMLGDSIVNDTGSSCYGALIERMYPKARVEVVTSVRGGTGCWYYQDENRIHGFVTCYKPDLVMVGGISHRGDAEAVRSVLRQVKAAVGAEILVLSGPLGADADPRCSEGWAPEIDPRGQDYRSRLMAMAAEEKLAFLDMAGIWGRYIKDCGVPYATFIRDPVHANDRGKQVLGRILEAYFAPKK